LVVILRNADLFAEWESFMASISNSLKIKYGLGRDPSEVEAQEWANLTRQLINQGSSREDAGHAAAKKLFPDYRTRYYASEADTIEYLLQQVGQKK
jgi:hypothetical protein